MKVSHFGASIFMKSFLLITAFGNISFANGLPFTKQVYRTNDRGQLIKMDIVLAPWWVGEFPQPVVDLTAEEDRAKERTVREGNKTYRVFTVVKKDKDTSTVRGYSSTSRVNSVDRNVRCTIKNGVYHPWAIAKIDPQTDQIVTRREADPEDETQTIEVAETINRPTSVRNFYSSHPVEIWDITGNTKLAWSEVSGDGVDYLQKSIDVSAGDFLDLVVPEGEGFCYARLNHKATGKQTHLRNFYCPNESSLHLKKRALTVATIQGSEQWIELDCLVGKKEKPKKALVRDFDLLQLGVRGEFIDLGLVRPAVLGEHREEK